MSTEQYSVKVGVELDNASFQSLKGKIDGKDIGDVKVNLDISDAENKIKSLKTQIQGLNKLKVNLNVGAGAGRSKASSGVQSVVSGVNDAYNDLKNLAKRINSIRIQMAGLDSSKDSQRIEVLRNQLEGLMATYNDTFRTFSKGFDMPKLNAVKKEIDSVESELNDLWQKFSQAPKGVNTSNIEQDIMSLESRLESLYSTYRNLGKGLTSGQIDNLTNSFGIASDKIDVLVAKAKDAKIALKNALLADFNNSKLTSEFDKISRSFDQIRKPTGDAMIAFEKFATAHRNLCAELSRENEFGEEAIDIEKLIAANKRYVSSLEAVESQIKSNQVAQKNADDVNKLNLDRKTFYKDIDIWMKNNSAAAEDFGKRIRKLQSQIESCDRAKLNNLKAEFREITREAELADKTGLKFTDSIKSKFRQYISYFSVASAMMEAVQALRYMYQAVLEVDTAMTELKRVTDLSATQYNDLYDGLTESAREYGVALNDLISATADWSRAGFDATVAKGLAEVTTMYQHIADVDYDTAVQNLLTAYKGFENELTTAFGGDTVAAVSYIGDILNELDNNYAVTAAGIGEALKRSASALDVAGNSIQETAGMVTGITEVTQDPEKAGNALKVVSMRLRGMKGQLEELGEETDENVTNLSKMQGQVLNLTHGKVNIFDDTGEFKSTYEIMQGIAVVWKELSTIEQADLLETIAGKHRANDVAALISNWENVEKAVVSATDATGSAAEEHAKYVDSIQGKLNTLTATFQTFSNTLMNSNLVKGVIDALTMLLDIIEKITDATNGFGTAGLLGALFVGIKKRVGISSFFGAISGGIKSFGDLKAAADLAKGSLTSFLKTPMGMFTGIGAVITVIGTVISLIDTYNQKQRELRQEAIDTNNSFSTAFGTFEQVYIKYADKTVLTTDEENELVAAIDGTISALGNKSSALKDAAGASDEYVSSLDKIAKAELLEAQRLSSDAKKAAEEQLMSDSNDWVWFSLRSKDRVTDIQLPKANTEEYKALQNLIESDDFQKYVGYSFGRQDTFLNKNGTEWLRFDASGDLDSMIEYYNYALDLKNQLNDYASETGDDSILDSNTYKDAAETVEIMSSGIEEAIKQTYSYEKANYQLKNGIATTEEEFYAMREAVLSSATASVDARIAIADLMNEEYADVFDLSSVEARMNEIKSVTKGIADITGNDTKSFETLLEMRTRVNNGECAVGDYIDSMENVNEIINGIEDAEVQEFLRVQLGLELDSDGNIEDEIIELKDKLVRDLTNNDVSAEVAEAFADSLSASELDAAVNLIAEGEIDLQNFDIDKAMKEIEEEAEHAEALRFTVDIDFEIENLEKLNEAVTETLSGTGLSGEGMSAVTAMFAGLDSYDPSKLFERTANGIRLNTDEYRRLNNEYNKTNLDGLNKKMNALADEYNETKSELADLTYGTDEYYEKASELSSLEAQINEVETLASQYKGLASAYNEWQMAEEAGNQRDMYESVIEGLETVKDEISRGWVDDGTVEFLELLTGKDLSSGNLKEIESAYKSLGKTIENTSYNVKDFFTVNDDGESTSEGVYNFLDAVGQLEEEAFGGLDIVKRDEDGNIMSFDFRIAGGDKAIADALGISEELVGIMVRAADDAGFVVSMDGTYQQLDVLKEKAAEAAKSLKDTFKVTEHSFFQDGSAEGVLNDYNEAMKVWETFKANKNADGTVNMNVEGAEEAFTLVSTLQSMVDQLNEPVYMEINASEVEKEMQTPLSKLQEYERLTQTEHQLKLKGTDTSEIDASQEEILDYFESLDPEIKAQLGIENLSREELQSKVEAGEIEIPATVDLQVEMNDTLKDMVNVALYNAGVIDKKELEARVDVSLYAEKVDTTDVESKTEEAVKNAGGDDKKTETTANVDVEAGKVDVSDVSDKTKEAIENVSGEKTDVEKSVDLEVKIDEYNELIENLEDADKDIKIKVTVEGLDQVQELNKNIDLATEIDGDIDNLSEFVEGAKALSELDSSIATYVTAEVNGNVLTTPEGQINNLKTFAESAKGLKDVESSTVTITANVDGDVIWHPEGMLDNLKEFAEGAEVLKNIPEDINRKITAEVNGDAIWHPEGMLNNLKEFSEGAVALKDIPEDIDRTITAEVNGDAIWHPEGMLDNLKEFAEGADVLSNLEEKISRKIEANIDGDVIWHPEGMLDNLKEFAEGADVLSNLKEDISRTITAEVNGDAIWHPEGMLDNLKEFADGATALKDVPENVNRTITANVDGDVVWHPEGMLDNLKEFAEGADVLANTADVNRTITANVSGDVIWHPEGMLDNLKEFAEGADVLADTEENTTRNITANISGDAIWHPEGMLDNLKEFAEGATVLANSPEDIDRAITANVNGDVVWHPEGMLDNLKEFAEGAEVLAGISDVNRTITANVDGDVVWHPEGMLDNLKEFAEGADVLANTADVNRTITANVSGDVIWHPEGMLDNLKEFAEGAEVLKDTPENISRTITANIDGDVVWHPDGMLNNIKTFAESAEKLKNVGSPSSTVTAEVEGDVTSTSVDNLKKIGVFADNASKLKGIGSPTSTATANIEGNVSHDKISILESFNGIAAALKSIGSVVVSVTANVATDAINTAIDLLSRVANGGLFNKDYSANVEVTAKVSSVDDAAVQNYQVPPKEGKVTYTVDSSQVDSWTAPPKTGTITYSPVVKALTDLQKNKTGTIRYTPIIGGVATGTAFAGGSSSDGVSGRAFARGDWGIKGNGVALAGELGQELVVRQGRFFTVGDNGAEFFNYRQGDIVFNAAQTESLFRYGGIKGAKPRGTMLATGTAFAGGSFPSAGKAFNGEQKSTGSINGSPVSTWNGSSSSSSSSKSSKSKSSSSSDDADEFLEKMDWIEIAIDRIERAISRLDLTASSVFKKWSTRNGALTDQIGEVRNEIDLQKRAYDRYIQEAESVGLSEDYAAKVRNGEIDIETITDEDLKEKIDEYQEWYEKALDCEDAIYELNETVSELYQQKFDNVVTQFEGILSVAEHTNNMIEEFMNQSEAQGWLTSTQYYDALIDYEEGKQKTLLAQRDEMYAALNDAVANGNIEVGSEAWVDMITKINDTTLAIEESKTAMLEYAQSIQELEWEQFDYLQDRISNITDETEFLIDLMSNEKLYDDSGQLTNRGMATMGLHGVNYNTYMHQADMAGAEAARLEAQLVEDPNDTELRERYEEMLRLQEDFVLKAEDEKEAIRDMVEEGIELELDALDERIEKYKENLNSAKDLYDYNKKVKEQTEEIAALEKQMAAYSGDDSEEVRAKVQELKVSLEEAKADLEETEYDKYISDQEALLDNLYLEYETILNERLDNIDLLMNQMIVDINANAEIIGQTIKDELNGENGVGKKLSDAMSTIWNTTDFDNLGKSINSDSSKPVITYYNENFKDKVTTTSTAIGNISVDVASMIGQLNKLAKTNVKTAEQSNADKSKESTGGGSSSGNTNNNNNNNNNTNNKNASSGDGKPKVGDKVKFVSGKYYYDSQGKSPLGSKYQGKEVYITHINNASWATHPYHISTGSKLGQGDLGWLKLSQLSGYATGKKNFLSDEVAWTQENGKEFIVRPSDGAILTPLAKGDSVLNAAASSNLWNMANSPAEFIRDSLGIGDIGAHIGSGAQTTVEQNFEQIVFSMPNVKNYDEMLAQMKKDKNFQRLVDSMGVDQLAGKSSLRKGKSIR